MRPTGGGDERAGLIWDQSWGKSGAGDDEFCASGLAGGAQDFGAGASGGVVEADDDLPVAGGGGVGGEGELSPVNGEMAAFDEEAGGAVALGHGLAVMAQVDEGDEAGGEPVVLAPG